MIYLYKSFVFLYYLGVKLAAAGNKKARNWIEGRNHLFQHLSENLSSAPVIWVHAASAGEFEQAKPIIETLKKIYPHYQVLVTFFSPSGYNIAKKYTYANYVTYLPLDTEQNANQFINLVNPKLVVFAKYDFWYFHLKALYQKGIPLLLISSIFRPDQLFFKPYGSFYKKMLHFFTHLFVQDATSAQLLKQHGIQHCSIAGDTRFDRVAAITNTFKEVDYIKAFVGEGNVIVAGSTWEADEQLLATYINNKANNFKLIVAPHEISVSNVVRLQATFSKPFLYSQCKIAYEVAPFVNNTKSQQQQTENKNLPQLLQEFKEAQVLIIDNIGMLSRLYYYATICYIGGGFTKSGIHNTLEAAVYGKPVVFGPNYKKFREAKELIEQGGAFSVNTENELAAILHQLFTHTTQYQQASKASAAYVQKNRGATDAIINYIQAKRLLTN